MVVTDPVHQIGWRDVFTIELRMAGVGGAAGVLPLGGRAATARQAMPPKVIKMIPVIKMACCLVVAKSATLADAQPDKDVLFYLGDPQIGFGETGWEEDVARFSYVAELSNKSNPAAVLVAGDLVNVWNNATLTSGFDDVWPTHFEKNRTHLIPGNHDVDSMAKSASGFLGQLAHYRNFFGQNYHSVTTQFADIFLIDSESLIVPFLGLNGTTDARVMNETETQWQVCMIGVCGRVYRRHCCLLKTRFVHASHHIAPVRSSYACVLLGI